MRAGEARVGRRVTTLPPPPGDADPASTHGRECVICAPQKELPCAKVVGPFRGLPLPAATRRTEAHRHAREATQTQGIIEPAHPQGRSSQERTLRRAGKKTYDEANRSGTSVERGAQPETRDGHRANGESTRKPKTDIGRTGSPPGNQRRTSGERGVHPETEDCGKVHRSMPSSGKVRRRWKIVGWGIPRVGAAEMHVASNKRK